MESVCFGLKIIIECKITYIVTRGNKEWFIVFEKGAGKNYELKENNLQECVQTESEV